MNVTRIPGKPARKLVTVTVEMDAELLYGIDPGHETTALNTVPGKTSLIRFDRIDDMPPEADTYRLDGISPGVMKRLEIAGIINEGWCS